MWPLGALALTVLSVASLSLVWSTQQRVKSLEQELVRRQQSSQDQSTEARLLARQAHDAAADVAAKLALVEARVAESALQRTQVEELIQSLSRSRDENVLADVEAGLRVAQQQSAITGSAEPMVAVLRQADERLARYNQPRLERVRRAVARDLDRVRAVTVADVPSLSIKLDEAVRQIDELPMLVNPERKVAAIGLRVQGGVSLHGFALNCDPDLAEFDKIVPCGITDAGVTSLSVELGRHVTVDELREPTAAAVADALDGRLPVAEHPVDRAEAPAGLDLRLHPSLG